MNKILQDYLESISGKGDGNNYMDIDVGLGQMKDLFEQAYGDPPDKNIQKDFNEFFKAGGNLSRLKAFVITKREAVATKDDLTPEVAESNKKIDDLYDKIENVNNAKNHSPERFYLDAMKELKEYEEIYRENEQIYNRNKSSKEAKSNLESAKHDLEEKQRRVEFLKKKVDPARLNDMAQQETMCEIWGPEGEFCDGIDRNGNERDSTEGFFTNNVSACEQAVADAREMDPELQKEENSTYSVSYENVQEQKYNIMMEKYDKQLKGEDVQSQVDSDTYFGTEEEAESTIKTGDEAREKVQDYKKHIRWDTYTKYGQKDVDAHRDKNYSSSWSRLFNRLTTVVRDWAEKTGQIKPSKQNTQGQVSKVSREQIENETGYYSKQAAEAEAAKKAAKEAAQTAKSYGQSGQTQDQDRTFE